MFLRENRILILIVLVSVFLRMTAAVYLGNAVQTLPGTADQVSYHALSIRILDGHGFTFGENWWPATKAGEPTAHWSYLYTLLLAGFYLLFDRSVLLARLFQALIVGILQPLLSYWIGARVFDRTIGIVSAVWITLYAYFIYYSGTLMTEPLYITAVLASLALTIYLADLIVRNVSRSRTIVTSLGLGLLLWAAVLLRQLFLLVIPLIILWFLLNTKFRSGKSPLLNILLILLVIIVGIAPFTAYNYARFDRFVLLNTNAGYAFYLSNHPIHGMNFISARDIDSYQDLYPPELLSLDEAALDSALLSQGIRFVVDDPVRYVLLSISRIPDYFNFWPLPESGVLSNLTKILSFGIMVPFLIIGIVQFFLKSRKSGFQKLISHPGILLLASGFVYSLIHILSWVQVRYRLPVDAILIPFAASGLIFLLQKLHGVIGARASNPKKASVH